ncbi:MAG: InlB B-repeat-containing protein [Bacterioplanes sp.]|nr:InlB B-repeat-containing protein [Bacterioplanes sp.]
MSFDSAGGSTVADITQDFGTNITEPTAPTRIGYTFEGWNPPVPAIMPLNGSAHTAQWMANAYILSFDSAGGSEVPNIIQDIGTSITEPTAPTRIGYTFAGWSPAVPTTMPVNGSAHTAQWTVNAYTMSFDSAGGSTVADITQDFGTNITEPTAPTRAGYTFAGWSPAVPTTMPDSDLTITAQWEAIVLTVTASILDGGSISPESANVSLNGTAEFQLTIAGGYLFEQASGCGVSVSGLTLTTAAITEDCTIQISFERVASAGAGTEADPFIITDGEDLSNIRNHKDSFFVLDGGEDSTLSVGTGWQPIGNDGIPFTGSLTSIDGNPVILSGLGGQPIFDEIGPGAQVFNLTIQGSQNLSAGDNAGLLANRILGTEMNPANVGNITIDSSSAISGGNAIGGLAGTIKYANLTSIIIDNAVDGNSQVGGLAGVLEHSIVIDILVNGDVEGRADQVGGIAGRIDDVGISYGTVNGSVAGESDVGGIGGRVSVSDLRNLAFNGQVTGGSSSNNVVGAVDPSTDVQQISTGMDNTIPTPFNVQLINTSGELLESTVVATNEDVLFAIEGAVLPITINGTVLRGNETDDLVQEIRRGVVLKDSDGNRSVLTLRNNSYVFRAQRGGLYELNFTDSNGQVFSTKLDIRAQVAFTTTRQPAATGEQVSVRVALQGIPAQYPVTVPYEVINHDLLSSSDLTVTGEFTFEAGGNQEILQTFRLTPAASVGNVIITLQQNPDSNGALLGNPASHRLVLREPAELPLPVRLAIEQGGDDLTTLAVAHRDNGIVTVTAINPATGMAFDSASYRFDWSQSALILGVHSDVGASVQINPTLITTDDVGMIRVVVTETSGAQRQMLAATRLRFVHNENVAANDAFTDFLTAGQASRNRLPICPQGEGNFRDQANRQCSQSDRATTAVYLEAPEGFRLTLGQMSERASWETRDFGLEISTDEIREEGADVPVRNARDTLYSHIGYLVDFEVAELDFAGQSVPVVIPLPKDTTIPNGAVWRKYIRQNWENFVVNDANQVFSASTTSDCPWPGSDLWKEGLNEGDNCVRLVIEDGGPNDSDGMADGVIRDPGTLAVSGGSFGQKKLTSNRGGLSSMGGLLLVLLLLVLLKQRRLILLSTLLTAGSVQAQNIDSWSFGLQLGMASTDMSNADVNKRLSREGIDGEASVSNSNRFAGRVFLGYQWNSYWGLETGLIDLGEITTRFNGLDSNVRAADFKKVAPGTGRGVDFAVVGRYPLNDDFDVTAKLGILVWHTSLNLESGGSYSHSGHDALVGLGIDYRVNTLWSTHVSLDRYKIERDVSNFISAGFSYHFGGW